MWSVECKDEFQRLVNIAIQKLNLSWVPATGTCHQHLYVTPCTRCAVSRTSCNHVTFIAQILPGTFGWDRSIVDSSMSLRAIASLHLSSLPPRSEMHLFEGTWYGACWLPIPAPSSCGSKLSVWSSGRINSQEPSKLEHQCLHKDKIPRCQDPSTKYEDYLPIVGPPCLQERDTYLYERWFESTWACCLHGNKMEEVGRIGQGLVDSRVVVNWLDMEKMQVLESIGFTVTTCLNTRHKSAEQCRWDVVASLSKSLYHCDKPKSLRWGSGAIHHSWTSYTTRQYVQPFSHSHECVRATVVSLLFWCWSFLYPMMATDSDIVEIRCNEPIVVNIVNILNRDRERRSIAWANWLFQYFCQHRDPSWLWSSLADLRRIMLTIATIAS